MLICLCMGKWVNGAFFVHATLIEGFWNRYYSSYLDIVQERYSMIRYFAEDGGNTVLMSVDCKSVNFMFCIHIPTPVMELVNTGYALSCTSLPHSSVTHSTALSTCSARREAPAGLH